VLVNCAGIAFKAADPTPHAQQAKPTFETNYFGTSGFTLAMLPLLRNGISPRIVTVASKSGQLRIIEDEEKLKRIISPTLTVDEVTEFASEFVAAVESGTCVEQGWPDTNLGMSQLCKIGEQFLKYSLLDWGSPLLVTAFPHFTFHLLPHFLHVLYNRKRLQMQLPDKRRPIALLPTAAVPATAAQI
jgi:hypothetical protein